MAIKVNGATAIDNSRNFYGNGSNLTGIGGGTTLIANIPMVGYGSLSVTGLNLSSYKSLEIVFYSFYPSGGRELLINSNYISGNVSQSTTTVFSKLYLDSSICVTSQRDSPKLGGYATNVTNATTSLTFSSISGYFFGQRIYIYGVA